MIAPRVAGHRRHRPSRAPRLRRALVAGMAEVATPTRPAKLRARDATDEELLEALAGLEDQDWSPTVPELLAKLAGRDQRETSRLFRWFGWWR